MSLAYKCDRCKICFDPYAVEGSDDFITITEMFVQNGNDLSMNKVTYRWDKKHLCPACADAFRAFWEEGERKETKTDEGTKAADISADDGIDRVGDYIDRFRSTIRKLDDLCHSFGSDKTSERPGGTKKDGKL